MSYKDDDSRDKNDYVNKNNDDQTTEIRDDQQILYPNYDPKHKITNSYFCFICGAVLTTEEDKKQHEIYEIYKSKHMELDNDPLAH